MTGRRKYDNFTQRAIRTPAFRANQQRMPANGAWPSQERHVPTRPVFFDLEIREVHKKRLPQEWPRVAELIAGHKYVLVLSGNLSGTTLEHHMCPQGIMIEETIELSIQFPPEIVLLEKAQKVGTKAVFTYILTYQDARGPELVIPFMLPLSSPTKAVTFSLRYREPRRIYAGELGQRIINVRGSHNPEDGHLLKQCQINAGLPAHAALLWIDTLEPFSPGQQQKIKLRGWNYQGKLLEERALIDPEASVSITKLREGTDSEAFKKGAGNGFQKNPEAIINTLSYFSRTFSPNLTSWLQQISLKKGDQERPCLIIVDNTALEIPWEMLELAPKRLASDGLKPGQKQYMYLGAIVQIARWLPFRCFARGRRLHVKKTMHTGKIISYVDPGLGDAKTQAEREALQNSGSQAYQTLEELKLCMSQPLPGVGLAYIGCHGREGNTLAPVNKSSIEVQKPSNLLKAINLETLYAATDPQLTVFLNACEAARVIRNGLLDRGSFVEGFLTHCASGFIGPLAPVDIQNASQIASQFLAAISSDTETSIIEALRALREQAVELLQSAWHLPNNEKRKAFYRVLDTFMYVYYGNPLAHLRLLADPSEQLSRTQVIVPAQSEKEGA